MTGMAMEQFNSNMMVELLLCLAAITSASDVLPGLESSRFGLNFNLCTPPLPPKIVYLPAPCRFDAEQEEIRLALTRLDANMEQKEVPPAADPVQSNKLDSGFYDFSTGRRGTLSPATWRLL